MPQKNYLVVGLGGTGCKVVRELKKKLYVKWREEGGEGQYPQSYQFKDSIGNETFEYRVATLSVDSNEGDMNNPKGWRVLGETLSLTDNEKFLLDKRGIGGIINNIDRFPGMSPWLKGDLDLVKTITVGGDAPNGCDQMRRLGRIVFANGNNCDLFISRLKGRLKELEADGQVGGEIHFAATLGCGTGAGLILDAIVQTQKALMNAPGEYTIHIHGFVTSTDIGSKDSGSFHENQYAIIQELNAFRLGLYEPWDIKATGEPRRVKLSKEDGDQGDIKNTFNSMALISETTEGGRSVDLDQQINNVAEVLYQISVGQGATLNEDLMKAFTGEDLSSQFIMDDQLGSPRATNFVSYGVQKLAIPEKEIREKLGFTFGQQFLLRTLYSNWDGRYLDQTKQFSRDSFVDDRRQMWKATKDYFNLNIYEDISGGQAFSKFEEDWTIEGKKRLDAVEKKFPRKDGEQRRRWLTEFDKYMTRYWEEGFRNKGVEDFFSAKSDAVAVKEHAQEIRRNIEKDLLEGFERHDSDYPLNFLGEALGYLKAEVENERSYFSEQAEKADEEATQADNHRTNEIAPQFLKIGIIAARGSKVESLSQAYRDASIKRYAWRTIEKASIYAQELTRQLLKELDELIDNIETFKTRFKLLSSAFQVEIDERIKDDEESKEKEDVTYLVDSEHVNDTIKDLFVGDRVVQDRQSGNIIKEFTGLRGDRYEFDSYNQKMPVDENNKVGGPALRVIRQTADREAVEAHLKMQEDNDKFHGIFGQNIMKKLYDDFGGQVSLELKDYLRELISKAMPMTTFSPNQEAMNVPAVGPVLRRIICFPDCKELDDEFRNNFKEAVGSIIGGKGNCSDVESSFEVIPEDRNTSEILVLAAGCFFSARFVDTVGGLRSQFVESIDNQDDETARMRFFKVTSESHNPRLPDLFMLSKKKVLEKELSVVLAATALDQMIIGDAEDEILFGEKDKFGRVKNKVECGMRAGGGERSLASSSKEKYDLEIPLSLIVLASNYMTEFKESALKPLSRLVESEVKEGINFDQVMEKLDDMIGYIFVLQGRKEDDELYNLFEEQVESAKKYIEQLYR